MGTPYAVIFGLGKKTGHGGWSVVLLKSLGRQPYLTRSQVRQELLAARSSTGVRASWLPVNL